MERLKGIQNHCVTSLLMAHIIILKSLEDEYSSHVLPVLHLNSPLDEALDWLLGTILESELDPKPCLMSIKILFGRVNKSQKER